jgi:AraC-like DNA-binding protein
MEKRPVYFQELTESTTRILDGANRVYYCEGYRYYSENAFRTISIKLPLTGSLYYKTEKHSLELHTGQLLVTCKQPGKAFFDNDTPVRSICVDINEHTFAEALECFMLNNGGNDFLQPGYFRNPYAFWNTYQLKDSLLKDELHEIVSAIKESSTDTFDETIFLRLSERVILQEYKTLESLQQLGSVKSSTKKEILKRLNQAKNYMDENYRSNPDIVEIARFSNLSQFHFFRSFKQAFAITPYQYILRKRLEYAKSLIENNTSVLTAAVKSNFPDIFTFSKTFKKHYGYPPSAVKNNSDKTDLTLAKVNR